MKTKTPQPEAKASYTTEVGFVVQAQDYLFHLEGLPSIRVNELIQSQKGARALVTGLKNEKVEAMALDKERPKPGDMFTKSTEGLRLDMGDHLLGRIINPLGMAMDGKGEVGGRGTAIELDVVAPGVEYREIIREQLVTGITVVDTLMPVGKGQRELIFGEPRSGKVSFLLDVIANQRDSGVVCVYIAIGKEEVETRRFVSQLEHRNCMGYTVVVAATSAESAPVISIAPDVGLSIAESFRDKGKDVLVLEDDLAIHAKYLREIALLSERIPGRESYPGDIFYQHAHNLERAGRYNEKLGKGSITLLPVIETDLEKFTALVPTNVMASTDGHLLFSASFRAEGRYPAVDSARSVTRVGAQTQKLLHKVVSDKTKALLAQYEELRRFSRFGAEVTGDTQLSIKRGHVVIEMLKQESGVYLPVAAQMILLGLVLSGYFDEKDADFFVTHRAEILSAVTSGSACKAFGEEITSDDGSRMPFSDFTQRITKVYADLPA